MSKTIHLVAVQGPDEGLKISVPAQGARLGRADKNDIVLTDPKLSRYHCRLFFTPGAGLCVADLGSANQTVINDRPVQETRLSVGDMVTVGDTVLKVVDNGLQAGAAPGPAGAAVDLGLREDEKKAPSPIFGLKKLLVIAVAMALITVALWATRLILKPVRIKPTDPATIAAPTRDLVIDYEKIQADALGIFRYHLALTQDGVISIQIDDTEKTHIREEGRVDSTLLQELADFIEDAGYFSLADDYQGIQPNVMDRWDLEVTIGTKHHRTIVQNRVEPDIFKSVRERIEKFGQVELGLWAVQFSPEKLLEMARDSFLLGKKLYDERDVRYGNLADAINSFKECQFYLQTVDPKPDFYTEALATMTECKEILAEKYVNQNFAAERAIRLKQWNEAAEALRVLCEMIPSRSDDRHREARTKLIEVESRLNADK